MDENEYRYAYKGLNPNKCVYEKAILTQHCHCQYVQSINIANRRAMACTNEAALQDCSLFLNNLRSKASFALKLTGITGNLLPHSKEVKVQKGGLLSFLPGLENTTESKIDNIYALIQTAKTQANGDLNQFPYETCLPRVGEFEIKRRIKKKK